MTDTLIVGFGSAGKRHKSIAEHFGHHVFTADPWVDHADYVSLDNALSDRKFDIVVIATPPESHLLLSQQSLESGASVLCEKPLCYNGQLEKAIEMMEFSHINRMAVAYNYRYHPDLVAQNYSGSQGIYWGMKCRQSRTLPSWGLLLDHVSHDIDILCHQATLMYGKVPTIRIESAEHYLYGGCYQKWTIRGFMITDKKHPFFIDEGVTTDPRARQAKICSPRGCLDIEPSSSMYLFMWQDFLFSVASGKSLAYSFESALETQFVLNQIEKVAKTYVE